MPELTTAQLFALARLQSDTTDSLTDDFVPWGELSPQEQAANAEGIRAVVEELERRGWVDGSGYRQRYMTSPGTFDKIYDDMSGGYINSAVDRDNPPKFHHGEARCSATPRPREWFLLSDVPHDVTVEDSTGDHLRWCEAFDEWMTYPREGDGSFGDRWWDPDAQDYEPFTEVPTCDHAETPLERAKRNIDRAIARAEQSKIIKNQWGTWAEVPEGTTVSSRTNDFQYRKAGGAPYVVIDRSEFRSGWADEASDLLPDKSFDDHHAPFTRVVE